MKYALGCISTNRMPDRLNAQRAKTKITKDFAACLPYWEPHFNKWTFVHNEIQGLPAPIARHLLDVNKGNEKIEVTDWSYDVLRMELFTLAPEDVAVVLGPSVGTPDMLQLEMDDVITIVQAIEQKMVVAEDDLRPVPKNKVKANGLSSDAEELLNTGMLRADLVRQLFTEYHDPNLGDRIAATFKERYLALRNQRIAPDDIFAKLWSLAGGRSTENNPTRTAATLAILAHLFEQCVVFERPKGT